MKTLFYFILLSFSGLTQEFPLGPKLLSDIHEASLPVYYFPFYNGVQIIEVDYYSQSLNQGALLDAVYPRGGSSFHDAMMINRSNGYLIRNLAGEITANYGVTNLQEIELTSPNSCKTITHQERLNFVRNQGFQPYEQEVKELNGYGYRVSRLFKPEQRTEMPEMTISLYGILDTLGNIAIPMNHHTIDYAHGEYLVERDLRLYNYSDIRPISNENIHKERVNQLKPYAIYDSTFQLTMPGSRIHLKRISKNRYAEITLGTVSFIDRFGTPLHSNSYQSIRDTRYSDLILYTEYKNDTLFQGLLSRQLKELTPAIFSSISSFKHGFIVRDRQQRNGYLNLQGRQIVPFELEAETINYRRDSFIVFTKYVNEPNGKMLYSGLMNATGQVLLPPQYSHIDIFSNEIACIKKNNKWGFINQSGEILCPIVYNSIGRLHQNFIEVTKDNGRGLVDRSGKVIIEPNYTYIKWIDSMIHYGNDKDEHFIYNVGSGGKYKHHFGKLIPQSNGLSFYIKAGKYGLVDTKGKLVIPAKFEKIRAYRNNRALVQLNGKFGLINEHGKIVQAIKYTNYNYDDKGNYVLN